MAGTEAGFGVGRKSDAAGIGFVAVAVVLVLAEPRVILVVSARAGPVAPTQAHAVGSHCQNGREELWFCRN